MIRFSAQHVAELAVAAALAAAAPGPTRAADLVCASTTSDGLICLDRTGFKQYTRRSAQLPDDRIADLVVCGATIYLAAGEEIVPFDGRSFGRSVKVGRGLVERLSCHGSGGLWAASQTALSRQEKDGWKHYELASIAGGIARNSRVRGLAAGPGGTVWATLRGGVVLHFDGREWRHFRQGHGFPTQHDFDRIAVDTKGQVWLPFAKGLYTWRAEKWEATRGLPGANYIVADDKNRLWLTSGARVATLDAGRKREIPTEQNTRAVAADESGNIWAATEFGLARYAATAWDSRQMHNSDLTDNDLMIVVTLGRGAPLPPAAAQAKGALLGKAEWSDGKPIAEADVQICGVRAFDFGIDKGPCDEKPLAAQTKTAADGAFGFRGVPPGNYHFVIRPKGSRRWIRFATDAERLKVKPGESKNSETLTIDVRQRDAR